MLNNKIKIIFDTNWYISATINLKSRQKLFAFLSNDLFELIYCDELEIEYLQVISRPKFRKYIDLNLAFEFFQLIKSKLKKIKIDTSTKLPIVSNDVKDNYLLHLSLASKSQFLISGDPHLLVLKKIEKTTIITMTDFNTTITSI